MKIKLGKWHFACARFLGNTFSPALCLEWFGVFKPFAFHGVFKTRRIGAFPVTERRAWCKWTIRTGMLETDLYWYGWLTFHLHSEHAARWFGRSVQGGPGGSEDSYVRWDSKFFGTHMIV